ncbi:putative WRKY transcription factor 7 [Glycine soja]
MENIDTNYKVVTDVTIFKFEKVISLLGRTRIGHVRFKRAPSAPPPPLAESKVYHATPLQQILPPTLHTHAVVTNHSLVPIEDLDHDVVDVVLEAKEEVKVAKVDVIVDGDDREAKAGDGEVDVGSGGGLAHIALARGEKGRIEAEEECEVRSVGGAREKVERGHWEGEKGRGRRRSPVVK